MIIQLHPDAIDMILRLQDECAHNRDIFLPTSRAGYLRAFQYSNFCLGWFESAGGELTAFLNCSIPTRRAANNLGRAYLNPAELDMAGHMNTLLVKSNCRRGGVGRKLVCAALLEFSARGCRHIFVTVSPDNAPSLRLLHSLDFAPVDIITLQSERRYLLYKDIALQI